MREYEEFNVLLPMLCAQKEMTPDELLFADFNLLVTEYVASLTNENVQMADVGVSTPTYEALHP